MNLLLFFSGFAFGILLVAIPALLQWARNEDPQHKEEREFVGNLERKRGWR